MRPVWASALTIAVCALGSGCTVLGYGRRVYNALYECSGLSFGPSCGECGAQGPGCTLDARGCKPGYYGGACNYMCTDHCPLWIPQHRCIQGKECDVVRLHVDKWYVTND